MSFHPLLTAAPYLVLLAWFGGSWLYAALAEGLLGPVTSSKAMHELVSEDPLLQTACWMAGIVAIEEIVFRLLLVGLLGLHVWRGFILLSLILFAVWHLPNVERGHWQRTRLLLVQLGNGAVLTGLFLHDGFLTALACHLLFNTLAVAKSRLTSPLVPAHRQEARSRVQAASASAGAPVRQDDTWQLPRPQAEQGFSSWTLPEPTSPS